jgi:hypothetical protein
VRGGRAILSPPVVARGTIDPRELEKRFAEAEVLVRRAVDPELKDIEELRERDRARAILGTTDGLRLSADDSTARASASSCSSRTPTRARPSSRSTARRSTTS